MDGDLRCILIGGTSNVGKSTLAAAWGAELGWPQLSTDGLGRHPGRPWPADGRAVPPHVVEHYTMLSDLELLDSNLEHYRTMWPIVERLVRAHADAPLGRLVLEGSGCWPDQVATLHTFHIGAIWLTADNELIARRIRRESRYEEAGADGRRLIQRFIVRSQLYNDRLQERLRALDLPAVQIEDQQDLADLIARCHASLRVLGSPPH